jgi:dethiobiotin synthetase
MTVIVVTGTGTEVGKTIVTAAIAAVATQGGRRVAVVKAAQTGVGPGDESDVDVVTRLSGVTDVHELVRYPEPLAPASAARRAHVDAFPVVAMAESIRSLRDRDLVLVEGAGGLLVRLDDSGATLADLARKLGAPAVVVSTSGLGSLNGTALTCEALRTRAITCAGIAVGAWPSRPDLADTANLADFEAYAGAPLLGAVPEGAGQLPRARFLAVAQRALSHRRWRSLLCPPLRLVSPEPARNERF